MNGPLSIDDIELLAAFVGRETVRGVAAELGLPRSTLSRRLSALESELGQQVFLRRGRSLLPTAFGRLVIERAASAWSAWREAQAAAGDAQDTERLTVATSPLFAELVLSSVIPPLLQRRPALRIALRLSHEYTDLFEEQVDVALRRGPIADSSSLNARRLGRTTMVCVAAKSLPMPSEADPEARARALPWIRSAARLEPFSLQIGRGRRTRTLTLMPRVTADSQRLVLDLVRRGLGVARVNAFMVREALSVGTLVEVLPELRSSEDVFAVYPRRAPSKTVIRDFLSALTEVCRRAEVWDR